MVLSSKHRKHHRVYFITKKIIFNDYKNVYNLHAI